MKQLSLIVFAVVMLTACNRKNKVPSGVLPPDKMEEVMWDMMRADILVTNYMMPKDPLLVRDSAVKKLYDSVYAIHHITEEKFNKSFLYYKRHPEMLKAVLDSISVRPAADQAKPALTDSLAKKDSLHRLDSLKKADSLLRGDTIKKLQSQQSIPAKDTVIKRKRKIIPVAL